MFAQKVLAQAIDSNSDIKKKSDIKAQTGFVHAYDLTKVLIAAIKQVKLTGNKSKDSALIHYALEHLTQPVQGLLKKHKRPFSPYSKSKPNAHEALSLDDYAMGQYSDKDEVVLLK